LVKEEKNSTAIIKEDVLEYYQNIMYKVTNNIMVDLQTVSEPGRQGGHPPLRPASSQSFEIFACPLGPCSLSDYRYLLNY